MIERNRADRLIANRSVLDAAGVRGIEEHTAAMVERMREVEHDMLRAFPVPVLHVDTTGDYHPGIDVVLTLATSADRGDLSP